MCRAALRGFLSFMAQEVCGRPFSISGTSGVSVSCLMFVTACSRADTHPTLSCLISSCCGGRQAAVAATLIASQQPWTSAKYSPMLELAQLQLLKESKYSHFLKCSRLCNVGAMEHCGEVAGDQMQAELCHLGARRKLGRGFICRRGICRREVCRRCRKYRWT